MELTTVQLQTLILGILAFGYFCELAHQLVIAWTHDAIKSWAEMIKFISQIDAATLLSIIGISAIMVGYFMMCLNKAGVI